MVLSDWPPSFLIPNKVFIMAGQAAVRAKSATGSRKASEPTTEAAEAQVVEQDEQIDAGTTLEAQAETCIGYLAGASVSSDIAKAQRGGFAVAMWNHVLGWVLGVSGEVVTAAEVYANFATQFSAERGRLVIALGATVDKVITFGPGFVAFLTASSLDSRPRSYQEKLWKKVSQNIDTLGGRGNKLAIVIAEVTRKNPTKAQREAGQPGSITQYLGYDALVNYIASKDCTTWSHVCTWAADYVDNLILSESGTFDMAGARVEYSEAREFVDAKVAAKSAYDVAAKDAGPYLRGARKAWLDRNENKHVIDRRTLAKNAVEAAKVAQRKQAEADAAMDAAERAELAEAQAAYDATVAEIRSRGGAVPSTEALVE